MLDKFMRNYLIKIVPENQEQMLIGDIWWYENVNKSLEGWEYPDLLTLHLDINRNTYASANEAHLQIYNLSPSNRQKLFHDRFRADKIDYIDVYAGYGSNLQLVFRGKILQTYSYKQGSDMITDIQAIDLGFLSYWKPSGKQINYTNMTLEAGTTQHEAIKQIVSNMENGVSLGALGSIDAKYLTPTSFIGDCFSLIDEITGGHVFVDLGKVNVLSDKEAIKVGSIPVINSESGLLSTPMRRDAQLEFDMIFEPNIQVGQLIEMQSTTGVKEYNSLYKVIGIHHSGVISSAVCGNLTTRLNVFVGTLLPNSDITATEYAEKIQKLSEVENEKVTTVAENIPSECNEVFAYIQKNKKVPYSFIPKTRIQWTDVIKENALPTTITPIANLYSLCQLVYNFIQIRLGNVAVKVSSGYRNASTNAKAGGSSTSLHFSGNAIDITRVGNLTKKQIYELLEKQTWIRELLIEDDCVHIGVNKAKFTRGYWTHGKFYPINKYKTRDK